MQGDKKTYRDITASDLIRLFGVAHASYSTSSNYPAWLAPFVLLLANISNTAAQIRTTNAPSISSLPGPERQALLTHISEELVDNSLMQVGGFGLSPLSDTTLNALTAINTQLPVYEAWIASVAINHVKKSLWLSFNF